MTITFPKTHIDYAQLQEVKSVFPKGMRSKSIYHYTSISGLEGILQNKKLRFTNIKYMNDKDEIIAGLESITQTCGFSEEEQEEMITDFTKLSRQTFVCCFSLEGDSLPMWNYYTKEINNQGYNIAFDNKKLVESILRANPCLDGCEFVFGNVDYSINNDSRYGRTIMNSFDSSLELVFSKLLFTMAKGRRIKQPSKIDESILKEMEEMISDLERKQKFTNLPIYFYNGDICKFDKGNSWNCVYFVKRDYFAQEHEFRIVITVPNEILPKLKENNIYKFRVSNGVMIPYIELSFSEDVVKSVTISPTVQSDLVEQSIQDFIMYCEYNVKDFKEFIKHSKIPVRF